MNNEKVLIVEDEENERTGLAELISSWGYSAQTAHDGQDGYEKVLSWSPGIVITDLKMPRLGGLELLEKISGDSQTTAVIVVTAQGTIDSAVQAMRIGAYDYITKPIAACGPFFRMPRRSLVLELNLRLREENFGMPDLWDRWLGHQRKCRKFSVSLRWSRPALRRY